MAGGAGATLGDRIRTVTESGQQRSPGGWPVTAIGRSCPFAAQIRLASVPGAPSVLDIEPHVWWGNSIRGKGRQSMRTKLVIRGLAALAGLAIAAVGAAGAPAAAATGTAVTGTAVTVTATKGTHPATVRTASLPGAFYAEAINRFSGKCINVAHGSGDNGAWIQQYHCDRTPAAKFLFIQNGEGYYEVQNQGSHKCIDIEFGGGWLGARTQQFNCNGSATQQFALSELGNGYVKFVNRFSGRCIDVPNYSQADSVVLQLWNCVGGAENQEFRLNIS
jgi:hypothetical protein